jgi:hypothetical protein
MPVEYEHNEWRSAARDEFADALRERRQQSFWRLRESLGESNEALVFATAPPVSSATARDTALVDSGDHHPQSASRGADLGVPVSLTPPRYHYGKDQSGERWQKRAAKKRAARRRRKKAERRRSRGQRQPEPDAQKSDEVGGSS